jgi:hypothetical protein
VTDRVRIFDGAAWNEHAAEHFFGLPETERVKHVLDRTVVFLRDGRVRDLREALTEDNVERALEAAPKKEGPGERSPTRRLRAVK